MFPGSGTSFTNWFPDNYWSSTASDLDPTKAWAAALFPIFGFPRQALPKDGSALGARVWAVRGGTR